MTHVRKLLGVILVAGGLPAWSVTECTKGALTRTIAVVYADPGQPVPCEVLYEKPTEQQTMTLWRAANEAGYCEARAAEFVEKLISLDWQCTDVAERGAEAEAAADGE